MISDYDIIDKKVKELVKDTRYEHSVLVSIEAERLAKHYGIDSNKAKLVGLAHDIAKDFSDDENKYWVIKYNLDKSLLRSDYRKMIHADVGAVVCKEWFNFSDDMCLAIKYHTVANEKMSMLDKIIFIADKIGRKDIPENIKDLKGIAYENIDKAMVFFLEWEQIHLINNGADLLPQTKLILKELRESISK